MSKPDLREPGPIACDECVFQHLQDSDAFFCLRHAPEAQRADGLAQWPKIQRGGAPSWRGCGDGRRKKDAA